jgi:hypothetical protein
MYDKDIKKSAKEMSQVKGKFESLEVNPRERRIFKPYVSTFSAGWLSNESEDQHPEYTWTAHPTINSSYYLIR